MINFVYLYHVPSTQHTNATQLCSCILLAARNYENRFAHTKYVAYLLACTENTCTQQKDEYKKKKKRALVNKSFAQSLSK